MSNSERRVGAQINTAPKSPDSVVRFPFWEKRLTRRQAGQTAGGVGLGIVSALHGARRAWAQEASLLTFGDSPEGGNEVVPQPRFRKEIISPNFTIRNPDLDQFPKAHGLEISDEDLAILSDLTRQYGTNMELIIHPDETTLPIWPIQNEFNSHGGDIRIPEMQLPDGRGSGLWSIARVSDAVSRDGRRIQFHLGWLPGMETALATPLPSLQKAGITDTYADYRRGQSGKEIAANVALQIKNRRSPLAWKLVEDSETHTFNPEPPDEDLQAIYSFFEVR